MTQTITNTQSESSHSSIQNIADDYLKDHSSIDSFWCHYYGDESKLTEFGLDVSPHTWNEYKNLAQKYQSRLSKIDRQLLTPTDQDTFDLLLDQLAGVADEYQHDQTLLTINHRRNRLYDLAEEASGQGIFPFQTQNQYEAFLFRCQGLTIWVDSTMATMKESIAKGYVHSGVIVGKMIAVLEKIVQASFEKKQFYHPIQTFPANFSDTFKADFTHRYEKTIQNVVLPQYLRFITFLRSDYESQARTTYGVAFLPQGQEIYARQIKRHTKTNFTAEYLHQLGLTEVARIQKELGKIKNQFGFKEPIQAFLKHLQTDPAYLFRSPQDIMTAFANCQSRIQEKVPLFFSTTPKCDFEFVEVPESTSATASAAAYGSPTPLQPKGRFYINCHNLSSIQTFGVGTLFLHEAVPGHHFQKGLGFDLREKRGKYRQHYHDGAFVEGWALYAEFLGREMQVLDDHQIIGSFSDELLRAVRLVVDTGIHHFGWSREKTISYMQENLPASLRQIESEADRYSVWPGQALAYKVGQIQMLELRKFAEDQLKESFDIKEFHNQVLCRGTINLAVLKVRIENWVMAIKSQSDQPR